MPAVIGSEADDAAFQGAAWSCVEDDLNSNASSRASVLTGLHRYEQILDDTAIATNILAERLTWLLKFDVLKARQYGPLANRLEYGLTRKGIDHFPVLVMLQRWGDMYYGAPEGPLVILHHRSCGHELEPIVACAHCVEPLWLRDTHVDISPASKRRR